MAAGWQEDVPLDRVRVSVWSDSESAEQTCSALGEFSFEALPAGEELQVLIRAPEELLSQTYTEEVELAPLAEGECRSVALLLPPKVTLTGRVLTLAGEPHPFAGVVGFNLNQNDTFSSETDHRGCFAISGLNPGRLVVRAVTEFFESQPIELEARGGDVIDNLELRIENGQAIAGRITWPDGTPAAGATVQVTDSSSGNCKARLCDVEGRFRIDRLVEGDLEVAVRSVDVRKGAGYALDQVHAPAHALDFELEVQPRLKLVLSSTDGTALPDVSIEALGNWRDHWVTSNEDGSAYLHLTPGKWTLLFQRHGLISRRVPLERARQNGDKPMLITMLRASEGGSVSGQVVLPDGAPAPSVRVGCYCEKCHRLWHTEAETDETGRFFLTSLAPGLHRLVADTTESQLCTSVTWTVEPGACLEGVLLQLRHGAEIQVQVVDAAGHLAPSANVELGPVNEGPWYGDLTDTRGEATIPGLPAGRHLVVANSPSVANPDQVDSAAAEIDIHEGHSHSLTLRLEPPKPFLLSGRVTNGATPLSTELTFDNERDPDVVISSNAAGRFQVELPGPDEYAVWGSTSDGFFCRELTLTPGLELVFDAARFLDD